MVDALTWRRVALLTLLGAVMVGMLMVFESRTTIFNKLFGAIAVEEIDRPWDISSQSKDELVKLTSNSLIGGVMLTEVDLKKNMRIIKYWQVRDADFRLKIANMMNTLLPVAFFDTDRKNNEQMVAVLNNQFLCTPTIDTVFARFVPDMDKQYPYVCRLAVPPFTGEFAGLLTITLTRTPSQSEVDSLKIEITRVAVEMYLRDIESKRRIR